MPIGHVMLYVGLQRHLRRGLRAISSRVLGTYTRATVRESVSDVRTVHPWLAAGVWSLVAAVFVTAPVDALTSLVAGAMA